VAAVSRPPLPPLLSRHGPHRNGVAGIPGVRSILQAARSAPQVCSTGTASAISTGHRKTSHSVRTRSLARLAGEGRIWAACPATAHLTHWECHREAARRARPPRSCERSVQASNGQQKERRPRSTYGWPDAPGQHTAVCGWGTAPFASDRRTSRPPSDGPVGWRVNASCGQPSRSRPRLDLGQQRKLRRE
jgi:hypothetical protein